MVKNALLEYFIGETQPTSLSALIQLGPRPLARPAIRISKRVKKCHEVSPLDGIQLVEVVSYERAANACMALDRIVNAERQSVVHQL